MMELFPIRPDEKEIAIVNGWCYVVWRSKGGSLFYVLRRSLSQADHGRRVEVVGTWDAQKEAEAGARRHMERVSKAVEACSGYSAPILYTNK